VTHTEETCIILPRQTLMQVHASLVQEPFTTNMTDNKYHTAAFCL